MAIVIKYKNQLSGIEVENAYLKIISINQILTDDVTSITINLGIYKDQQSRDGKLRYFETKSFSINKNDPDYNTFFSEDILKLKGNSLLSQCFKYIKSLKEYGQSTDK